MLINEYEMRYQNQRIKEMREQRAREQLIREARLASQREHERLAQPDFEPLRLLRSLWQRPASRRSAKQILAK